MAMFLGMISFLLALGLFEAALVLWHHGRPAGAGLVRVAGGVLGAGAVGGWVAARLALAGSGQVMALSSRGPLPELRLSEAGRIEQARLATFDGTADLLVVAVKAPALPEAVHAAGRLIGTDTLIVPMLNGVPWWFTPEPLTSVDPSGRIAAALSIDQVIGCVVHAACRRARSLDRAGERSGPLQRLDDQIAQERFYFGGE